MINPDKYIRRAYLIALANISSGSVSVPVFDRRVPISVKPIPSTRIIISSQTKSIADETKCGHGWDCSILLDIISEQNISFVNTAIVDDIEEQISNMIDLWQASKGELLIPPFKCYRTAFSDSHDMDLETPTLTIIRKVIRYTHRINSLTADSPTGNGFPYTFPFELA